MLVCLFVSTRNSHNTNACLIISTRNSHNTYFLSKMYISTIKSHLVMMSWYNSMYISTNKYLQLEGNYNYDHTLL